MDSFKITINLFVFHFAILISYHNLFDKEVNRKYDHKNNLNYSYIRFIHCGRIRCQINIFILKLIIDVKDVFFNSKISWVLELTSFIKIDSWSLVSFLEEVLYGKERNVNSDWKDVPIIILPEINYRIYSHWSLVDYWYVRSRE